MKAMLDVPRHTNQAIDNALQSLVRSTVNMHFFVQDKSKAQSLPGTQHPLSKN
jgi:hypothetical protein